MTRPPFLTNLSDVPRAPMRIARTGEVLGLVAMLGDHLGLRGLRVQHEILPPGHRSSSPHAHTTREELVYVLEGQPDAWIDGHLYPLGPGDVIGLPAGTGIAHTLINDSDRDAHVLTIATMPDDDRCFYPLGAEPGDVPPEVARDWAARPRGPHDGRPGSGRSGST